MKNIIFYTKKFSLLLLLAFNLLLLIQCVDDDDNGNVIYQETCDDGIQNGNEQGVDCGGEFCSPCDGSGINFEGTFVQEDIAGRPAVNMIFGFSDLAQNEYNVSLVSNRSTFQEQFEIALEAYHDIYALSLDIPTEELDYETNILNWNANVFTTVLSEYDALQVAPNATTTYLDADENIRGKRREDQSDSEETIEEIKQRDHKDMHRDESPLIIPKNSVIIDNTNKTKEETIEEIIKKLKLQ